MADRDGEKDGTQETTQETTKETAGIGDKAGDGKTGTENIRTPDALDLVWGTDEEIHSSLDQLFAFADSQATEAIAWYQKSKRGKKRYSQGTRLLAIFSTTVGGLLPIVFTAVPYFEPWSEDHDFALLGYLFLGLAGAAVALDKFFGYSHSWMRYMTTAQRLQGDLVDFRLDWERREAALRGKTPESEELVAFIDLAQTFLRSVDQAIQEETKQWLQEFSKRLAEMDQRLQEKGGGK